MNIIIRFFIVKKIQKLENTIEFTLQKKNQKFPNFFAHKRKLSYKIIDHWHHPTFPKGLQQWS